MRKRLLASLFCVARLAIAQLPGQIGSPERAVRVNQAPVVPPPSDTPAATPSSLSIPRNLSGSVASGEATSDTLALSLIDAIARGLKYNLALIEGGENTRQRRAERLSALSQLLPNVTARVNVTEQQINLAAFGFSGFSGFSIPTIVGPFSVYDARGYVSQPVLDLQALRNYRAAGQNIQTAELSARDLREQITLVVTGLYLQALAAAARVESADSQVATAEALFKRASDRKAAGTSPAIDVVRGQVQLQQQQQRRIFLQNEFEKNVLDLGRAIGLPGGQKISLSGKMFDDPLPLVDLQETLAVAYRSRRDYLAAASAVKAAELSKGAARAERLPVVSFNANYGAIGNHVDQLHGTFSVAGDVTIPVFQGGRVEADVMAADAGLQQRRAELENLRGQIENEVRRGFLDAQSAYRQVQVARSSVDLARQQLEQSQDRFAAGVTNNVEVVQSQEAVATANENLISSLYAFNIAKAALVRARGDAEQAIVNYLKGKQ